MHPTSEHESMRPQPGTLPSASAIEAAISLLVDPDPGVVAACRRQLLRWGQAAADALGHAANGPDPRLRLRARALLRTLHLGRWLESIERFADAWDRAGPPAPRHHRVLETGALLVSSIGRSEGSDRVGAAEALGRLADELRQLLSGRPRTAASAARVLREHLGGRVGYASAHSGYYALDAVLLDEVVRTRRGSPIALAILYVLVGRRAGVSMSGVGLPDRVLVRVQGVRSVMLDPARGGRSVTNSECLRRLRASGYTGATSSCVRELDDRQLLLCLLSNLRRVYGYREDRESLQAITRATHLLAAR